MPTLVALLVCLIPTTIGALLAAIGIAGMDRALRANIMAKSGKAVEVAGDVDTLLLDKTGTITVGNRRATQFVPFGGFTAAEVGRLAALASAADETPEGKSIVELVPSSRRPRRCSRRTERADRRRCPVPGGARFIAFHGPNADERHRPARRPADSQGAPDAILRHVTQQNGTVPAAVERPSPTWPSKGATPLLVSEGSRIAGMVVLEDILKPGIAERFERLRRMGLRTVMVTGDNPLTAEAIAEQAGVDDFIAEATPEAKLAYIRKEQAGGKLVAMMGDGTNDAPALAQADVGVAMNSGTQAAKEAGNMVDLDSDPTKLIEVVEIGKQLLMTRGALTTFSIANDVAKYFAIVPALFAATLPWLKPLDIMGLHSATSAILSAVIFNAIIIPLLIPIALKGRQVSPRRGRRPAPPQPADLGPGRRDRPVHRHQADRHDPGRLASVSRSENWSQNMSAHLRANLWLLVLTVLLCSVLYPLVLLGIGQTLFHDKAQGSLLTDAQRQSDRLAAHRPAVHGRRVFPTPAFGGVVQRGRLRRFQLGGQQLPASRPRGTPAWPDREISPAAPRRASRSLPTSKAGSRRTNSTGNRASWPNGRRCIRASPGPGSRTGSRPTSSMPPTWPTGKRHMRTMSPSGSKTNPNTSRSQARGSGRGLAGGFFTSFSKDHPGTFPGIAEYEKDGKTAKTHRPRQGRQRHSIVVLRHVASGASRRRPGAGPGRHGDDLRFGP